jgi:bacillithiol biosynthesis deacetylase BshB1
MKILAVGAHPDDVEFGCAPILIQEARRGHEVWILVTSQGEAASSGTPAERAEEAREAARLMGASIEFVEMGGDCHIEYKPANAMLLARKIREHRPQVVLAPHPDENQHPDHAVIGRLTRDAARLARFGGLADLRDLTPHPIGSLYFYAITQTMVEPPQVMIDVSSAVETWQAAIRCHKSQMKTRSYPELVTARARTLGASIGVDYATGLWLNDPVRVESLADLPLSARYF